MAKQVRRGVRREMYSREQVAELIRKAYLKRLKQRRTAKKREEERRRRYWFELWAAYGLDLNLMEG